MIDFYVKQAYYMYGQCLDVLFRATVDVFGVVKKGQVDVVSFICQNSLCICTGWPRSYRTPICL
jgi:hypothetical protein